MGYKVLSVMLTDPPQVTILVKHFLDPKEHVPKEVQKELPADVIFMPSDMGIYDFTMPCPRCGEMGETDTLIKDTGPWRAPEYSAGRCGYCEGAGQYYLKDEKELQRMLASLNERSMERCEADIRAVAS